MKKQKQKQNHVLSPAQQHAWDLLRSGIEETGVLLLQSPAGYGRSTILRQLHGELGGRLLEAKDFLASDSREPDAIEEAFLQALEQALAHHNLVIVDDLHMVTREVAAGDGWRAMLLDAALTAILGDAAALHKRLIFGTGEEAPFPLARRATVSRIRGFGPADYACICGNVLGPAAGRLDFVRIYCCAPDLSAAQLLHTCAWLSRAGNLDTQVAIDYLRSKCPAGRVRAMAAV